MHCLNFNKMPINLPLLTRKKYNNNNNNMCAGIVYTLSEAKTGDMSMLEANLQIIYTYYICIQYIIHITQVTSHFAMTAINMITVQGMNMLDVYYGNKHHRRAEILIKGCSLHFLGN